MNSALFQSDLRTLPRLHCGKVRDIYAISDSKLLVIQTDRLSAFDVVLPDPIPGKGAALTALSNFWFPKLDHIIPNHLTGIDPEDVVGIIDRPQVAGRAMVVKRLRPIMVEAIVRGYIIGSGWKDYKKTGMVCGIKLPVGLKEAQKLPEVIFTPSTKAPAGTHDENITYGQMSDIIGEYYAHEVRNASIRLYSEAAEYALTRGIIIADTKFEFGVDDCDDGKLYLIDEVLTPDSSRFWPVDQYRVGMSPPSFDKQFVRDWLETQPWDKKHPAPNLPPDVLAKTTAKYQEALTRLTS